jgi:hypothetical protein
MNKKNSIRKKNNESVEGDAQLGTSIFGQGDMEFANELVRKFGNVIEMTNEPFGDYVFSLVNTENGGIIDVYFANDLTYMSLPSKVIENRLFARYNEETMKNILLGNRDNDEILVLVRKKGKTIGELEMMKYKDIVAGVYYYGFEAKRIGNIIVLESE